MDQPMVTGLLENTNHDILDKQSAGISRPLQSGEKISTPVFMSFKNASGSYDEVGKCLNMSSRYITFFLPCVHVRVCVWLCFVWEVCGVCVGCVIILKCGLAFTSLLILSGISPQLPRLHNARWHFIIKGQKSLPSYGNNRGIHHSTDPWATLPVGRK